MYGQYRSGDVCVPHIKTITDLIDVDNIDFFCSVKTTTSFHTNDGSVTEDDLKKKDKLTIDEIQQIQNFLSHQLSPVSINFLDDNISELDFSIFNLRSDFLVFTGIIDSILLKQKHEAETSKKYDAVILLRYDFIINPIQYISKVINQIKRSSDLTIWGNDPDLFFAVITNDALLINITDAYTLFNDSINDLLMLFTGTAADRLCYELIDNVHTLSPCYSGSIDNLSHDNYKNLYDCHVLLTHLSNKISLKVIDLPAISSINSEENGVIYPIAERINKELNTKPMLGLVRPSIYSKNIDPSTPLGFKQLMEQWIVSGR
jgi:hypothetical protein